MGPGSAHHRCGNEAHRSDPNGQQDRKLPVVLAEFTCHGCKGQATLCVQSAQYRTRSSEIAFLRTVLVWLSTCIPYQLNIVSDYAITQYRTNASEIAHLVRIVCSGLNCVEFQCTEFQFTAFAAETHSWVIWGGSQRSRPAPSSAVIPRRVLLARLPVYLLCGLWLCCFRRKNPSGTACNT